MATAKANVLLHEVRMRIVLALAGQSLTTAEISRALSDVPQATLYRHIAVLADAGVLETTSERQTRGAVEKTYSVVAGSTLIGKNEAKRFTAEDHRRGISAFAGALASAFGGYLDSAEIDLESDTVSYRQMLLDVTPAAAEQALGEIRAVIDRYALAAPGQGSKGHLVSLVMHPLGR